MSCAKHSIGMIRAKTKQMTINRWSATASATSTRWSWGSYCFPIYCLVWDKELLKMEESSQERSYNLQQGEGDKVPSVSDFCLTNVDTGLTDTTSYPSWIINLDWNGTASLVILLMRVSSLTYGAIRGPACIASHLYIRSLTLGLSAILPKHGFHFKQLLISAKVQDIVIYCYYLFVKRSRTYCPNLSSKFHNLNPKQPSNSLPFLHHALVTENFFRILG